MSLFSELKRRNVFRVAIGYIGVSWLVIQVVETLFSIYEIDESIAQIIVTVLAIGFVPAIILAWVFEWTPDGIKRDSETDHDAPAVKDFSRRIDRIIIAILSVAVIFFAVDKFWPTEAVGPSIAVIPFENVSGDPAQDPFATGMTKQMRRMLTSVNELRVIADYSVSALLDEGADRKTMADELRLTHFLEGSIQAVGDKVRVTAELIGVADGTLLWSDSFDREMDDIFAIQDEIAAEVLGQLKFDPGLPATASSPRIDIEALKLFVRADHLLMFGAGGASTYADGLREAATLLEEALQIEPEFIDALLDLALARYRLFDPQSTAPDMELLALADAALEEARRIDPDHPVLLSYLATTAFSNGEATQDIALMYERAIEGAPTNSDVILSAQQFMRSIGRFDVALAVAEFAVDRDPRCADCWYALSQILRDDGRHKDAENAAEVSIALGKPLEFSLATTHLYQHEPDPMLDLLEDEPLDYSQTAWAMSLALYTAGRKADFDAAFTALRNDFVREDGSHPAPHEVAMVYAWSGQIDEAFHWLGTAVDQTLWELQKGYRSPFLFNLHGDPRWNDLLRSIERHPEQLAQIEFDPDIPAVRR